MYKIVITDAETGETLVSEISSCIYAGISIDHCSAKGVSLLKGGVFEIALAADSVVDAVHSSMRHKPAIYAAYAAIEPESRTPCNFRHERG